MIYLDFIRNINKNKDVISDNVGYVAIFDRNDLEK